ncbi:MAG TPA: hypothetical protein PLH57_00570 [Oligoflexia bacterium]|nr:hypothetical protein [Oligoflexia bacterium]
MAIFTALFAATLSTNAALVEGAPKWATLAKINRVADRIERALEWDIRRVRVRWFSNADQFAQAHNLKGDGTANILAVTHKQRGEILIGPLVTPDKFEGVLGHEFAHVIIYQKYKTAIPPWLEEGLANQVAGRKTVEWKAVRIFLEANPEFDVRTLGHPFKTETANLSVALQYSISTALMQTIASRCRVYDLLQMSVGYSVDTYLKNLCQIDDLNTAFRRYVFKNAGA